MKYCPQTRMDTRLLHAAGICVRLLPDTNVRALIGQAQVEAAARAAGLEYRHLPVAGGYQSPEEVAAFRTLVADLPHPLLAFCRSGARSTRLYQLAQG